LLRWEQNATDRQDQDSNRRPPAAIRRAGLKAGQEIEIKSSAGMITILPKRLTKDDEYTPAQRRAIDAELDEAEKGPFYGPFETADAAIGNMKARLKKRVSRPRSAKKRPRPQ
jgi:hypothetical protein